MSYKGYDLEAQFDYAGYICIIRKNGRVVNRIGYCGYSRDNCLHYGKNWVDSQ